MITIHQMQELEQYGIHFVESEIHDVKVEEIFSDSKFEWIEGEEDFEGFYIRQLSDGIKTDKEILLGNPNL